jgi:hypothetical protein
MSEPVHLDLVRFSGGRMVSADAATVATTPGPGNIAEAIRGAGMTTDGFVVADGTYVRVDTAAAFLDGIAEDYAAGADDGAAQIVRDVTADLKRRAV